MFMSLFANANRDPKKSKQFKFEDFYPFSLGRSKKDWESLPKARITDLLHMFKGKVKNAPKV
jgi:hypothetical protein